MIFWKIAIAALVATACCPVTSQAGGKSATAVNVVFGYDPGPGKYDGVVGKPTDT